MAYDTLLAQRVRNALADRRDLAEKKMFGGLCFLLAGRMAAGIVKNDLMLKVGPEAYEDALAQPHARPMDFTGRPMRGMVYVSPQGIATESALAGWLRRATSFHDAAPAEERPREPKRKGAAATRGAPRFKGTAKSAGKDAAPTFTGFAPPAFAFLRGLAAHNEREWFQAHQDGYHALYDTGIAFVAAIGPKLAKVSPLLRWEVRINGSVFRIQRDIRFSKDKTPYKAHLDLWFWVGSRKGWEAPGCFFRMFPHRLILGAGMHRLDTPQLERYRRAVVDARAGKSLADLLARLEKRGYQPPEAARKQVPRGFDSDHPRAALLLRDGVYASYDGPVPREASSARFVDFCLGHFKTLWPVSGWLTRHVLKRF